MIFKLCTRFFFITYMIYFFIAKFNDIKSGLIAKLPDYFTYKLFADLLHYRSCLQFLCTLYFQLLAVFHNGP